MRPFPMHAEIGVGQARTPVPELREKRAGLRLIGFQLPDGCAIDAARMAVVFTHPLRCIAHLPLLGRRVLSFKREHVTIAARLAVQITAEARQETEGLLKLRGWIGYTQVSGFGLSQLGQPAEQLIIPKTARSFLDVRLEMVEGIGVLAVALPRSEERRVGKECR